jgi:hypothetical protein
MAAAQATPDAETEALLEARLGGTRHSFVEAFGQPSTENSVNGSTYAVDGFGMVLVQYRLSGKDEMAREDRSTVITLRSERPEGMAATDPDPADWSIDQALQAVERFLPGDVELEATATPVSEPAEHATLERSCQSGALAEVFGDLSAGGGCQIAFLMPTPLTVSYITLLLGSDDLASSTDDPCAELPDWGRQSGARMESALSILDEISGIDETATDAPDQLRTDSAQFGQLASDQEAGPVPARGARANEQLVLSFNGFATAVDHAADGLEQQNNDLLGQALDELDSARSLFDAANALVLSALQRCDLIEKG